MPAPTTDNPPSQWAAIVDYSKSVVTLSVALLGLTVTFAEKLVPATPTSYQLCLLNLLWILLVLALLSGVLCVAFSISYLRAGSKERLAVLCADLAFFLLLGAGGLLVLLGLSRSETVGKMWGVAEIVREAEAAASNARGADKQWELQSLERIATDSHYEATLTLATGGEDLRVVLDPINRVVTKVQVNP